MGELSEAGRDAMRGHGIRSVIDIRTGDEVAEAPSPYAAAAAYIHAPFALGRTMQIDQAALAGTMPTELAKLARPESGFADVVRAIARAEPGVVLHCVAGRDRTGFIVAVILMALGVADDDVIADYVASDAELEQEYQRYIAEHAGDETDIRASIARRAETMRVLLKSLRAEYGDGAGYLRTAGVAEPDIDAIRAKLTA